MDFDLEMILKANDPNINEFIDLENLLLDILHDFLAAPQD